MVCEVTHYESEIEIITYNLFKQLLFKQKFDLDENNGTIGVYRKKCISNAYCIIFPS